jgi:transposase
MVRDLRFKKQEMALVEGELRKLMKLLDYQLETMPGIDVVTASALVAEIGDIQRFPNAVFCKIKIHNVAENLE